jgi:hypothetical protein
LSLTANSARSRSSASASTQASVSARTVDAAAAEQVHHAQVPVAQHRDLVLQALQRAVDVVVSVDVQRLLQVVRQAVVVHHDAELLAVAGAVHAGDGLQQLGLADRPVEVHHTLDRRVEAGQQHRLDDQKGQRVCLGRVGMQQRLLEALDSLLLRGAVGPLFPSRVVVVTARDDRRELDPPQHLAPAPCLYLGLHGRRPRAQRFVVQGLVLGAQPFSFDQQLVARGDEGVQVAHHRQPAVGHHLGLEAVGQDVRHVVAQHVARLVPDQVRRLEDLALGGVLCLIASSSSGVCSRNRSSNRSSRLAPSFTAPCAVRPS